MATRSLDQIAPSEVASIKTSSNFRINNFDGIRLFAASQVMVFHCLSHFEIPVPFYLQPLSWFSGVPIFFVISGFLISTSFERRKNLKNYFTNRALRIFPGLWLCLFSTLIVFFIFKIHVPLFSGSVWLLTQIFGAVYTPSFLSHFGMGSYNGSLWTIPLELQFYVTIPFLYVLFIRNQRNTLALILVFATFLCATIAINEFFPDIGGSKERFAVKLLRYTFVPKYFLFLFGVLLQRLKANDWDAIRGKGVYWLAACALYSVIVPQHWLSDIVRQILVGATMISLAYTQPNLSNRLLGGTDISYGVYLYHGLVINILFEMGQKHGLGPMLIVLITAPILGLASWTIVEKRAIRRKPSA